MIYFVARRILFLIIGFFIVNSDYSGIQIILNIFMNLIALIFVGSIRA